MISIEPTINENSQENCDVQCEETRGNGADGWPLALTKGGTVVRVFRAVGKKGYVSFNIAYYQHGERKREVLSDETAARKRARALLKSLADGEVDAASMRLQDIRAYRSANALLAPTGVTLETACREYSEAFSLLRGRSVVQVAQDYAATHWDLIEGKTVAEVAQELEEAKTEGRATRAGGKATRVSEKYVQQLGFRLDRFKRVVSGPIGEVTSKQLNDFIVELKGPKGEQLTGRTRNNYIESIRQLFGFAKKQKYIPRDSAVLDDLERCEQGDFEIEIFSVEEMKKLLAAAADDLAPLLAIGAFAGLRYYEITRLDWSEVNLKSGHIEVKAKKAKTRARRLVPINPNLAAWLRKHCRASGPAWPLSETYLCQRLLECAAAAGVTWKHNALRHSFISNRVATLKNVHSVALEAGNSPDMIFQHYRELVRPKEAKAWFAITPESTKALREKAEQERQAKIVAHPALAAA